MYILKLIINTAHKFDSIVIDCNRIYHLLFIDAPDHSGIYLVVTYNNGSKKGSLINIILSLLSSNGNNYFSKVTQIYTFE